MRNFFGRLACGTLVLVGAVMTIAAQRQPQLYISVVGKNIEVDAIDRMVTAKDVVVVTKQPVANALLTSIAIPATKDLYFVESNQLVNRDFGELLFTHGAIQIWRAAPFRHPDHDAQVYVRKFWPTQPITDDHSKIVNLATNIAIDQKKTAEVVDAVWLKAKLEEFSGAKAFVDETGTRVTIRERRSANGKTQARAWLRRQFAANGFVVSEHRYGRGTNFIAEKTGQDPNSWILLSAHMDSVGNAGADDDGSGVITSLAVASQIQAVDLKRGIRILSFDQEEDGLLGSKAYVRSLNATERSKIKGVINIEMTGYDKDRDGIIHAIHCNENSSKEIADEVQTVINQQSLNLKIGDACTNRSDHAAFWSAKIPAIVISQNFFGPENDANPCYHRSCDRVDILNFDYMLAISKAITATTKQLLQ